MTMLLPGMPVNYGMPYAMPAMMPGVMPGMMSPWGGMVGAPVYISSLSQLPPGAIPASQQMLAQALGQAQLGAHVVQQPSKVGSIVKGAAIGAAAGAAFGMIPFLPLGPMSGALVGAGVGAVIGLLKKPKVDPNEPHVLTPEQQAAQAQAQMVASTPPGARSAASTASAAPVQEKVVMGPAMRKRWAAKVRAERTAAAERAALSTPPVATRR